MKKEQRKLCIACEKPLSGRSDKIFCNDLCRASFNNKKSNASDRLTRSINKILGKNRRILRDLQRSQPVNSKVSREQLLREGFQFKYLTHVLTYPRKVVHYFCYDFGYAASGKDLFTIVKVKP